MSYRIVVSENEEPQLGEGWVIDGARGYRTADGRLMLSNYGSNSAMFHGSNSFDGRNFECFIPLTYIMRVISKPAADTVRTIEAAIAKFNAAAAMIDSVTQSPRFNTSDYHYDVQWENGLRMLPELDRSSDDWRIRLSSINDEGYQSNSKTVDSNMSVRQIVAAAIEMIPGHQMP